MPLGKRKNMDCGNRYYFNLYLRWYKLYESKLDDHHCLSVGVISLCWDQVSVWFVAATCIKKMSKALDGLIL